MRVNYIYLFQVNIRIQPKEQTEVHSAESIYQNDCHLGI